jgi:hypothetical protein
MWKAIANPAERRPNQKKLMKIFWIEEQIGDAKVFAKFSRHHGKKKHPAYHQDDVSSKIV